MNNSVIRATNLCKEYIDGKKRVNVLQDLNIDVREAEIVSIVGASGTGKSTLLHLLGGLDKPTSGEVFVKDVNLIGRSEKKLAAIRNQHLGFVYQFHHLLTEFSALENVAMPCLLAGWSIKASKKRALELLDAVGLKDRLDHRPGALSGGERQRIAFSRALATQPDCVLADEPTGNLDEETAHEVFKWMLELNNKFKTSFILVTHDKSLAKQTDRTLLLQNKVLV